jgi:transposase, IS5 family
VARRHIEQERVFDDAGGKPRSSLETLNCLIDWAPLDQALAVVYAAAKGEPAWPPLAMFKALLLAVWHDLSDVRLAEALNDRASFRRFCGFSGTEATPERTAFVRYRKALIAHGLDRRLFEAVTAQLKSKAITIKAGTLPSSSRPATRMVMGIGLSTGAGPPCTVSRRMSVPMPPRLWSRRSRSRPPTSMTDVPAPMPFPTIQGTCSPIALSRRVFRRCRSGQARQATHRLTAMWGRDERETLARLDAWNAPIDRVRARIEKLFGTWKRCYGLRRMRWRGLAKATAQVHFTATAYNTAESTK